MKNTIKQKQKQFDVILVEYCSGLSMFLTAGWKKEILCTSLIAKHFGIYRFTELLQSWVLPLSLWIASRKDIVELIFF